MFIGRWQPQLIDLKGQDMAQGFGALVGGANIEDIQNPARLMEFVEEDSKRIFGVFLCADEHTEFHDFLQKAWKTIDRVSGRATLIFTLEVPSTIERLIDHVKKHPRPADQFQPTPGSDFLVPNRAECFDLVETLFERPSKITLPGFAIFPDVVGQTATYFCCSGMTSTQLSELTQLVFQQINESYIDPGNKDRFAVYDSFLLKRGVQQLTRFIPIALKASLAELIKLLIPKFLLVSRQVHS